MKEKVQLLGVLLFFLILIFPTVIAANEAEVDKAYECLNDKIEDLTCSQLSTTEKAFSLLATNKCESELKSDSSNNECWPSANCDIKTTSQAILALKSAGASTSDSKNWLVSQNGTSTQIQWYLQTDTPSGPSTCEVSYSSNDYFFDIGEDKKLTSSDLGNCLELSENGYWLGISSSCYNQELTISCDESFYTNLLFQKPDSTTIHVSEDTHSASEGGITTEKVNSLCLTDIDSETCNYEGTLWGVLALDALGEDVSPYMPYIIALSDSDGNDKFLPESFLYHLTNYPDFYQDLFSLQLPSSGYWDVSGGTYDKYYDTALALLSFPHEEEISEVIKSQEALLEDQQSSGCWNSDNLLSTAFILHSVWPKDFSTNGGGGGTGNLTNCESAGYTCTSSRSCYFDDGEALSSNEYFCEGTYDVCCDVETTIETCSAQGGEICGLGEECSSGTVTSSDTTECCLETCIDSSGSEESECVSAGGICEPVSCGEGYESSSDYSCDFGDTCCFRDTSTKPSGSKTWLWVLLILIVLVTIAILFRDKLKLLWLKLKGSKSKSGPRGFRPGPGPGFPPLSSTRSHPGRIMPRRVFSSPKQAPSHPKRPQHKTKSPGELDDILKKLKEMGNK